MTDGLGGLNPNALSILAAGSFGTVSTSSEECGPVTEDPYPNAPGIWLQGWDDVSCFNTLWDPDLDGVHNGCENALAAAFAPELRMTTRCDWDYALDRMGGEYYVAVQRRWKQSSTLRIAYMPAYYVDCGSPTAPVAYTSHAGDSEFILVDVTFDVNTQHWLSMNIFLSAHCPSNDCAWFSHENFAWLDGRIQGAPIVWVAEGKKANYYSKAKCDSGGWLGFDTCNFTNVTRRFPFVLTQQNIGSRSAPMTDCGTAMSGSPMTQSVIECMWSEASQSPGHFRGWQSTWWGAAPSSYGTILGQYAGF